MTILSLTAKGYAVYNTFQSIAAVVSHIRCIVCLGVCCLALPSTSFSQMRIPPAKSFFIGLQGGAIQMNAIDYSIPISPSLGVIIAIQPSKNLALRLGAAYGFSIVDREKIGEDNADIWEGKKSYLSMNPFAFRTLNLELGMKYRFNGLHIDPSAFLAIGVNYIEQKRGEIVIEGSIGNRALFAQQRQSLASQLGFGVEAPLAGQSLLGFAEIYGNMGMIGFNNTKPLSFFASVRIGLLYGL